MIFTKCLILCGHSEEVIKLAFGLGFRSVVPQCFFSQAWDLYMTKNYNTKDGMIMLQLIAIECYRIGEYWVAAKAFDMLEKFSYALLGF